MDQPKPGFVQNDPSQGPQQAAGVGGSMDAAAVNTDDVTLSGEQRLDGQPGAFRWGNPGNNPAPSERRA